MSMITPLNANPASTATGERKQLSAACSQFEAIFVRQILASARKAGFGDEMFGSSALDTFREMQDGHFADIITQKGSLGLAAQIEAQVARFLPPTSDGSSNDGSSSKGKR